MSDFNLSDYQAVNMRRQLISAVEAFREGLDISTVLMDMYMDAFRDASFEESALAVQNVIDSVALFYKKYNTPVQSEYDFETRLKATLTGIPEDKQRAALIATNAYLDNILDTDNTPVPEDLGINELFERIAKKAMTESVSDEMLKKLLNPEDSRHSLLTYGALAETGEQTFMALEVMALFIMSKNGDIPQLQFANIELLCAMVCADAEFSHLTFHALEGDISELQYEEYKRRLFRTAIIGVAAGAAILAIAFGAAWALAGAAITADFAVFFLSLLSIMGFYAGAFISIWKEGLETEHARDTRIYLPDNLKNHVSPGLLENEAAQPLPEAQPDTVKEDAEAETQSRAKTKAIQQKRIHTSE